VVGVMAIACSSDLERETGAAGDGGSSAAGKSAATRFFFGFFVFFLLCSVEDISQQNSVFERQFRFSLV
jgi:hypothetical protein